MKITASVSEQLKAQLPSILCRVLLWKFGTWLPEFHTQTEDFTFCF